MTRVSLLRRLVMPAAALALACAALPAGAQTTLDDPLDARDAKRLDRMEKVMRELRAIVFQSQRNSGVPIVVQPADTDARLQGLANRLGDLEQTLTRVNGSLETAYRDLDQAKRDNAALQAEIKSLTERMSSLESGGQTTEAPPADTPPAPAASPTVSAAEAFTQARQLMLSGDYDAAQQAFADYLGAYPDSAKAPEARYWWGKTLSVRGAYAQAATAYIGAIRGWPQTSWAPDAVVELSRALIGLKKPADACQTLAELTRRYPKAPAAVQTRATAARAQAKCAA